MKDALFIGLMSGTSLDGVDAAIVNFNAGLEIIETYFQPYPEPIKKTLLTLQHPSPNELAVTAEMSNTLAELYAQTVNALLVKAGIEHKQITAIGCHGQTIRHQPTLQNGKIGYSLQIGNAALLTELTHISVVSDFRNRDIAAGGEGAPLVPAFHAECFSSKDVNRAIINIGGIANISYLPKTLSITHDGNTPIVFGFDSGPGNMLMDAWTQQHLDVSYDQYGKWASTGQLIEPLLSNMLVAPYFKQNIPKSTGRDLFHHQWLTDQLESNYQAQDVAYTLVMLTAHSIVNALNQYCGAVDEVYICGGGAHNHFLMQTLNALIKHPITLQTTQPLGMHADWVEAAAFAWLAKKCINCQTANLPSATGAAGSRILGTMTQS